LARYWDPSDAQLDARPQFPSGGSFRVAEVGPPIGSPPIEVEPGAGGLTLELVPPTGGESEAARVSEDPAAPSEAVGQLPPIQLSGPASSTDEDPPTGGGVKEGGQGSGWSPPVGLLERLERLAAASKSSDVRAWCQTVQETIGQLGHAFVRGRGPALPLIARLVVEGRRGDRLSDFVEDEEEAVALRRVLHALGRRVDVWRRVLLLGGPTSTADQLPRPDAGRLSRCVMRVARLTRGSPARRTWRDYLGLDNLERMARQPDRYDGQWKKAFARAVLHRLCWVPMTAAQRRFATSPEMLALRAELRYWAAEPVDLGQLLQTMERFELTRLPGDGRMLAGQCLRLSESPIQEHRDLGRRLEINYRNANLRVTVSQSLLNRLAPERESEFEWVRDRILGTPVRGRSWTRADVSVQLVPDPDQLRFAVRVAGLVSAVTAATSGPATFYNDSHSTYEAWTQMGLTSRGIAAAPTEVSVENNTWLRRLKTDFDVVPFLNLVVRQVARSQLEQRQPAARREIRRKVAARVRERIDEEVRRRLGQMNRKYRERVWQPLHALGLAPTMIEAETTADRLAMRLRLAGLDQLAGYTPRPRLPPETVASFQVHESAINNLVQKLQLDGYACTLGELRRRIATRLNRPELLAEPLEHEDLKIVFAPQDAVSVQFEDGRIAITLSIAALSNPARRWRDFRVRAFYRPEMRGRVAVLVRDGVVQLIESRRRARSQIALRGIFAKVFHKDRAWRITPQAMATDPRLDGLEVSHLVVAEGWLSLAWSEVSGYHLPVAARPAEEKRD